MSTTAEHKREHKAFMKQAEVIETHVSDPYVIVRVQSQIGRRTLVGLGIARCGVDDVFDARIGMLIAHSRAITDLMCQADV